MKRRLLGAERYKETLKDLKVKETKLGFTLEKLTDKLEFYKDDLDQCKIDLIAANQWTDDHSYKDTHLDLPPAASHAPVACPSPPATRRSQQRAARGRRGGLYAPCLSLRLAWVG